MKYLVYLLLAFTLAATLSHGLGCKEAADRMAKAHSDRMAQAEGQ